MNDIQNSTKKTILITVIILFMFGLLPAISKAQSDTTNKKTKTEEYWKNGVKINITSLIIRSYNFSYERLLTRKISFVASYSTLPQNAISDLPVIKKIADKFLQNKDDINGNLDRIVVSNNSFTGEFRFYNGKEAGARGFYLSAYGRYTSMKVNYQYDYDAGAISYNVPVQADLTGFGGGLMLGVQKLIAKRVVLDFYILGAHYGKLSGDAIGITDLSALSPAQKNDLKNELDNLIESNGKKYLSSTVTDNGVTAKVDGPFLGIRIGINLGIAF